MRRRILDGLGMLDGRGDTLLMLWSSAPDADPADPVAWRSASPYWDEERHVLVGDAWRHVVSGQAVRDPLEPDAVEGFKAQYLNLWPALDVMGSGQWLPGWVALEVTPPAAWSHAAVEASYGWPPVVAFATRVGDRVVVSAVQAKSTADAAELVRAAGLPALVGKSLLADAVWDGVQVEPRSSTKSQCVTDFRRLVDEDVVRHDGSAVLADQVGGCQVEYGAAGARVASTGRVDAVKAALWAAQAAWAFEPWFVG